MHPEIQSIVSETQRVRLACGRRAPPRIWTFLRILQVFRSLLAGPADKARLRLSRALARAERTFLENPNGGTLARMTGFVDFERYATSPASPP